MNRALRVLFIASLVVSCAPSGDDPLSRLDTWEAPTGDYRIRYLAPPWAIIEEDLDGARFQIESTLMASGRIDGGVGKYELQTSRVPRSVEAEMDREVRASRGVAGRSIEEGPRAITTHEGIEGLELITFDVPDPFERYRRVVLFPLGASQTLRLDFDATPDLDSDEVTEMIRLVGIGPAS
ncbi:MAG: hypothetical protein H6719_24550 [Sandaracinaceae bacterium]|nr:hypothetical protein [Sandaracinaceae bacterium]